MNIMGAEDARRVVFHEFVGHFGLKGFFGDEIRPALDLIHVHNPLVRQYIIDWMKNNTGPSSLMPNAP